MTQAWREQKERSAPWVVSLIVWIALRLGRPVARALLWPISAYFFATSANVRRESRRYLSRVLAQPVTAADVFHHIYMFAACALDRVYVLAGHHERLDVTVHDPGNVLPRLHAGGAAIVLTAHHGSFEVLRVLGTRRRGMRFRIVMDRGHGQIIGSALDRLNPGHAGEIIDAGAGPQLTLALHEALAQGSVVGLMADRVFGADAGLPVQFLGAEARLPSGPWKLAAVLGSPVLICFGIYRGGNRYEMHFESFSDGAAVPRAERQAQALATAQRFATRLEHYVRLAPYNWFNFYDYWAVEDGQPNQKTHHG
ncbi:MAG: acyltransferase [Nevskia sp.]